MPADNDYNRPAVEREEAPKNGGLQPPRTNSHLHACRWRCVQPPSLNIAPASTQPPQSLVTLKYDQQKGRDAHYGDKVPQQLLRQRRIDLLLHVLTRRRIVHQKPVEHAVYRREHRHSKENKSPAGQIADTVCTCICRHSVATMSTCRTPTSKQRPQQQQQPPPTHTHPCMLRATIPCDHSAQCTSAWPMQQSCLPNDAATLHARSSALHAFPTRSQCNTLHR